MPILGWVRSDENQLRQAANGNSRVSKSEGFYGRSRFIKVLVPVLLFSITERFAILHGSFCTE